MCFKLLRSTSCALIHLGNLLQDLHCVIPHLFDTSTPAFPPLLRLALTFPWQPSSLFSCVRHFPRPLIPLFYLQQLYRPIIMLIQTIQANHNAGSIRIQLQKEHRTKYSINVLLFISILLLLWSFLWSFRLTNPTGRCQTRPAGCCPSGPGCGQGLAMDQCGGPGRAECQHGSQHLPSWGPKGCPGRRLLGRPGRRNLKGKRKKP